MHQRYDLVVTGESLPGRALRPVRAEFGRFEGFLTSDGLTATITDNRAVWRYVAIWEKSTAGRWILCTAITRAMPAYASRAIVDDLVDLRACEEYADDLLSAYLPARAGWIDRHPLAGLTAIVGTGAVVWSLAVYAAVVAVRALS